MNSIYDMLVEAQRAVQKIDGIIVEEMESKATECVASIQAVTPVGVYPQGSGRTGGKLRRFMTHDNIKKVPGGWSVKVGNSLSYTEAVENGHSQTPGRYVPAIGKKLKKSFVPGKHMIRDNVDRYQEILNRSIQDRIEREV